MNFNHDEEDLVLDINMSRHRPATRHSPEEPSEMEIIGCEYADGGRECSDDLVEHLMDGHYDEIFEQYVDEYHEREREDW